MFPVFLRVQSYSLHGIVPIPEMLKILPLFRFGTDKKAWRLYMLNVS